jgi:flagellin
LIWAADQVGGTGDGVWKPQKKIIKEEMKMIINHNMSAMNAHRNLFGIGQSSQKTMEKLSSGLRINRAADDAAGLAISETMRNAIRSMKQASRNSQDAISLLQTAEGALGESQTILARIKELAIQAANDTYTSNDRIELQKEVDALKGELNRIANSCNFNGKNLLDGSSSALVSADKGSTHVLIRGSIRNADGTSAAGDYKITVDSTVGQSQILKSSIFKNVHEGDTVQHLSIDDTQNITHVSASDISRGDWLVSTSVDVASPAVSVSIAQFWQSTGSAATGVTSVNVSSCTNNLSILVKVVSQTAGTNTYELTYYVYDKNLVALSGAGKSFTVTLDSSNNTGAFSLNACGGGVINFNVSGCGLDLGDEMVINVRASMTATADCINLRNFTATAVTLTSSVKWAFNMNAMNGATKDFYFMSLDNDGTVHDGKIGITAMAMSSAAGSGTAFTFGEGLGEVSSLDTQLKDVDRFYDPNGRFMVDNPQVITLVQGDGTTTSFSIFGTDTLKIIKDKLNEAIRTGLGQGELVASTDEDKFVSFVTKADTTTDSTQSMEGGFVIRSARAGLDGVINIVADEGIVNALGITTAQEAVQSGFTVTVADPLDPTDTVCENLEISGNMLSAVLHPNIDVKFDSLADMSTTWDATTKTFGIASTVGSSYETNIHIVDNTQVFQIGGTEGQSMGAAVGDMRLEALGIDNILITDIENATKAVAKLDTALSRISTQRASLGAVQNRLEYNISNLGAATENLQASESRVRDADMAGEMMEFARLNILSQSTMAMLAQANQQPQQVLQLLGR